MNRSFALMALFAYLLPACSQEPVNERDVERLIRGLAADSLAGRASLTRGNAAAARLIRDEFASIGLEPIPGEAGFDQPIPVTVVKPRARKVVLNGTAVPAAEIFVSSSRATFRAEQGGTLTVAYIGKDANFRQRYSAIQKAEKDALVLIAPEQKKTFDRYRRFIEAPSIETEPQQGSTIVAVLADSVPVASYSILAENSVETESLRNVAGMIRGKRSGEIVLFSAHYDHIGILPPVEGDSIANGADDDASGTTAVMTLARYFKQQGTPERTLYFVAFAAEEIGGYGSRHFSKRVKPESIVAMCNIEMIGMPSRFGPESAWITGFDLSTFGTILQEGSKGTGFAFHPDPYTEERLFYRSDNATLARLGVPAHSLSSSQLDKDPYYHTVNDEVETLDLHHMTAVIRGIAKGMEPIVAGKETPTRIKEMPVRETPAE